MHVAERHSAELADAAIFLDFWLLICWFGCGREGDKKCGKSGVESVREDTIRRSRGRV